MARNGKQNDMNKLFDPTYRTALCNIVRRAAIAAGDVTLDYFDESGVPDAMVKADGSPVTQADQAAEELIIKALQDIDPAVPIVAEEAVAAGRIPDLTGQARFWLVDPLDGTRGFISGSGEYCVNIALVENGAPVLGVIYAPVGGDLYAGFGPDTALRYRVDDDREKPIQCRRVPHNGVTVTASRHFGDADRLDRMLDSLKVEKMLRRSSALKFCAIAAGKADVYIRTGETSEWDSAAGHAILLAAGGDVVDQAGRPLTYGHADRGFKNPDFAAASDDALPLLDGVFVTPDA